MALANTCVMELRGFQAHWDACTLLQHSIMYACFKTMEAGLDLSAGYLAGTGEGGGDGIVVGLEKLFWGYGPWFGGIWISPKVLGDNFKKS